MTDIAIISAVRTPVGKFQGALADFSAIDFSALFVREAVSRAHLFALRARNIRLQEVG